MSTWEAIWPHLELGLVGLIMASSIDPSVDDAGDFGLWSRVWDDAKQAWDRHARDAGWIVVGAHWEYHSPESWR
jgi:hypothetical protein